MRFTTPQDTGNRMLHHRRIECTALYIGVPNVNDRDGGHPPFRVVRIRLSVMPCGVVTVVDALHIVADAEDFPMVIVNREGKGIAMEFRITRREMLVGCLAGAWFACMATGCQASAGSVQSDDNSDKKKKEKSTETTNPVAASFAAKTPYLRVIESGGGDVSMTVEEVKNYVATSMNIQYKVIGLVTPPDSKWESKMYSPTEADPSEYIEVHYRGGIWPRITETEEMALYLQPGSVYEGVVSCDGSTEAPDDGVQVYGVDFEDMRAIVATLDAVTIQVDGYISCSEIQEGKSSYALYYLFTDAEDLIKDDVEKGLAVMIEKSSSIKVKDGAKVRVEIRNNVDIIDGLDARGSIVEIL